MRISILFGFLLLIFPLSLKAQGGTCQIDKVTPICSSTHTVTAHMPAISKAQKQAAQTKNAPDTIATPVTVSNLAPSGDLVVQAKQAYSVVVEADPVSWRFATHVTPGTLLNLPSMAERLTVLPPEIPLIFYYSLSSI